MQQDQCALGLRPSEVLSVSRSQQADKPLLALMERVIRELDELSAGQMTVTQLIARVAHLHGQLTEVPKCH